MKTAEEILADATLRYDDDGKPIEDWATCGHCGRTWNDALVSELTPAPSGRCPFEYEHVYDEQERYYDPPDDRAHTVFDPTDETFGPIMAAIQKGDFEDAAKLLLAIDPHGHACPQGEISSYRRIDLDDGKIVQAGICTCGEVIARRYVVTGKGTGPWTVLNDGTT